jgi:hypothetical protein
MGKLEHLKIHNAPKAFAEFAEKHNDLISLVEGMEGALGIDVHVAHTPRKKLKIGTGAGVYKPPQGKIMIGGLVQQLNQQGSGQSVATSDLATNVATLEALVSGLSRTNVNYCASNVSSVKTILMS